MFIYNNNPDLRMYVPGTSVSARIVGWLDGHPMIVDGSGFLVLTDADFTLDA